MTTNREMTDKEKVQAVHRNAHAWHSFMDDRWYVNASTEDGNPVIGKGLTEESAWRSAASGLPDAAPSVDHNVGVSGIQVDGGGMEQAGILSHEANSPIAVSAEKSSDISGGVIVVDIEDGIKSLRFIDFTDRTHPSLLGQHFLVIRMVDTVGNLESVCSASAFSFELFPSGLSFFRVPLEPENRWPILTINAANGELSLAAPLYGEPCNGEDIQTLTALLKTWHMNHFTSKIVTEMVSPIAEPAKAPQPVIDDASVVERFRAEKYCCTVCAGKKLCHVCGEQTDMACSDCRIDLGATVYVCAKRTCRDAHDTKCPGTRKDAINVTRI